MKTFIGYALILLGIVSLLRIEGFGRSIPESIGMLIGIAIISLIPGILLIRSGNKDSKKN